MFLIWFRRIVTRPAYQIAESEALLKQEKIRMGVYKVICYAVKHHGHGFAAQISLMQGQPSFHVLSSVTDTIAAGLMYFEHLAEPVAEILGLLEKEFDSTQLSDEILR